jgi:serine phosphatase RsbU (regulator of sigma subunit)/HAMP domain-containing protein
MKIRPKLIIAELILSVMLFAAVFVSITAYVNYMRFEELKIKTAVLQDTAGGIRFTLLEMLTRKEPASFLILEYQLLEEQMTQNIQDIHDYPYFRNLSEDVQGYFKVIQNNWDLLRRSFVIDEIQGYLDLRSQTDGQVTESLVTQQAVVRAARDAAPKDIELIDDAVTEISLHEKSFNTFVLQLSRALDTMLEVSGDFRLRQTVIGLAVPFLILVVSMAGITLFANRLSGKLVSLDKALFSVAGGDFSIRVDMKGRDEFNSLATSINAFTRTLGAKMESFRLIMHDIGQTLSTGAESAQVEATLLRLAMRETVADGAALYKVSGESGELMLSLTAGKFRPPFAVADLPDTPAPEDIEAILRSRIIQPGSTILGETAISGKPSMIQNVAASDTADWVRVPEDPLFVSSIITVPLTIGSTVFGVIAITSTRPGGFFSDLEYANMQSFAELAAITLDNIYKYADLLEASQLNRELGIAEEIQQDLLPKKLPRLPGGEIAYMSRSIKGLNGDYFDVYPLGNGKTMITICEVAGRGVPAGLVMVMIRTILRLVADPEKDARSIMTLLNQDMTRRIAIENYASVGILIMDSAGSYSFSSAAHYPLQVFRSDSVSFEEVQTQGIPVGIDRDAVYQQVTGKLGSGDIVLFHTDGIPECRNREGNVFGIPRLLDIVKSRADDQPDGIIGKLKQELEYFERGTYQKDDQTVIIFKFTGGNAS